MWPLRRKKQIKMVYNSDDKDTSFINIGLFDKVNSLMLQKIYPSLVKTSTMKGTDKKFESLQLSDYTKSFHPEAKLSCTARKKSKTISNAKILKLITPKHFFNDRNEVNITWSFIGDFTDKQRTFVYIYFLDFNSANRTPRLDNKPCRKEYIEFKVYNTDRLIIEYLLNTKSFKNEKEVFLIYKKLCELEKIQHFLKNFSEDFNPETYQIIGIKNTNTYENEFITMNMKQLLHIINQFWKKFKSFTIYILQALINDYDILSLINTHDLKTTVNLLRSKLFWMKCDTMILMNLKAKELENFLNTNSQNTEKFKEKINPIELLSFYKQIDNAMELPDDFVSTKEKNFELVKKIKVENEDAYFDFIVSFNSSVDSYSQNINLLHKEIIKRDKLLEAKDFEINLLEDKLKNRKEKYNLFI